MAQLWYLLLVDEAVSNTVAWLVLVRGCLCCWTCTYLRLCSVVLCVQVYWAKHWEWLWREGKWHSYNVCSLPISLEADVFEWAFVYLINISQSVYFERSVLRPLPLTAVLFFPNAWPSSQNISYCLLISEDLHLWAVLNLRQRAQPHILVEVLPAEIYLHHCPNWGSDVAAISLGWYQPNMQSHLCIRAKGFLPQVPCMEFSVKPSV